MFCLGKEEMGTYIFVQSSEGIAKKLMTTITFVGSGVQPKYRRDWSGKESFTVYFLNALLKLLIHMMYYQFKIIFKKTNIFSTFLRIQV